MDGVKAGITVNGVPVKRFVLDTGANEAMVHAKVKVKLGDVSMKAHDKAITGISGTTTVMPRTAEALAIAIYTDDPAKEVHASSQFVVMEGESCPTFYSTTRPWHSWAYGPTR